MGRLTVRAPVLDPPRKTAPRVKSVRVVCEYRDCLQLAVGRWVGSASTEHEPMHLYFCADHQRRKPGKQWTWEVQWVCVCRCGHKHDRTV